MKIFSKKVMLAVQKMGGMAENMGHREIGKKKQCCGSGPFWSDPDPRLLNSTYFYLFVLKSSMNTEK
jgi:hypothetical protein